MNNEHLVVVEDLKKHFGDVRAVDGISFSIGSGEVFGLLGPNGAGKTTTVKLLLGLLSPTDGRATVLGMHPERDEVAVKARVGYVAEEPLIYKSLTPRELFEFIASVRGMDSGEVSSRALEYMDVLGAAEYYDQVIATLSRGNKQKVQIVAAVLHHPELLIMDEPLAGLDAKSVKVVKELMDLHVERGGAILFSTHIMEVAQELCDRLGIINKGKMVAMGTLDELRTMADRAGATLEDVFLRLTEEDESVAELVAKLRQSYGGDGNG